MLLFVRDTIVDTLRTTKYKLQEEIGLEFIHNGELVAAFTNVEKHIRFLLKQPGIQGAIQSPNNIMVMYDYLGIPLPKLLFTGKNYGQQQLRGSPYHVISYKIYMNIKSTTLT